MSEEKDKKNLNQNKSEPSKSEASNVENNPKASPKEKTTEEKLKFNKFLIFSFINL